MRRVLSLKTTSFDEEKIGSRALQTDTLEKIIIKNEVT